MQRRDFLRRALGAAAAMLCPVAVRAGDRPTLVRMGAYELQSTEFVPVGNFLGIDPGAAEPSQSVVTFVPLTTGQPDRDGDVPDWEAIRQTLRDDTVDWEHIHRMLQDGLEKLCDSLGIPAELYRGEGRGAAAPDRIRMTVKPIAPINPIDLCREADS